MAPLPAEFFTRATVEVARDLLGSLLRVRGDDGRWTAGRIVETEAYGGEDDPASHAGRGRTPRSEIMFGAPGVAYVYLIYGVHHCLNIVTGAEGQAGAVLIRALEPFTGLATMAQRRNVAAETRLHQNLCNGPGKLCQALGIDLAWNGTPLTSERQPKNSNNQRILTIDSGPQPVVWQASPRIGITRATNRPHRFTDPQSTCLSR